MKHEHKRELSPRANHHLNGRREVERGKPHPMMPRQGSAEEAAETPAEERREQRRE